MNKNVMAPLIVGLCLMAVGSSAKAIIDVAVLKAEYKNVMEHLILIRDDIKTVNNKLNKE